MVIFRFGKMIDSKGPGMHLVIPFIDQAELIDTRITTVATPLIEELTKDNVAIKIAALCLFQIVDAKRTVMRVENFSAAIEELTQATLRATVSQYSVRQLVADRNKMNSIMKDKLEKQAKDWGIKITSFELKEIKLPVDIRKALLNENFTEAQLQSSEI